jgi:hypothetical protein
MSDIATAARAALEAVLARNPAAVLIVYEAPHPHGHIQGHVAVPNSPSVAVGLAITGLAAIVPE